MTKIYLRPSVNGDNSSLACCDPYLANWLDLLFVEFADMRELMSCGDMTPLEQATVRFSFWSPIIHNNATVRTV